MPRIYDLLMQIQFPTCYSTHLITQPPQWSDVEILQTTTIVFLPFVLLSSVLLF